MSSISVLRDRLDGRRAAHAAANHYRVVSIGIGERVAARALEFVVVVLFQSVVALRCSAPLAYEAVRTVRGGYDGPADVCLLLSLLLSLCALLLCTNLTTSSDSDDRCGFLMICSPRCNCRSAVGAPACIFIN